ncbi:MAG: 16S rRNA (cytidine(1402)-2'-O)-methyltransferase [Candidatus Cloacimonetes bacterium]|nr:16S rRNA (cytidine(1402)-2'-O)-methyltransferase [Candidatus Cloacimonadota bacterium]
MKNKGILYLVPTPIGNLKDITLRAIEILKAVDLIGAEDTRTSGYLLKHYEIDTPQISYHKFNEKKRSGELVQRLLNGENIAIISDAGSPAISDPAAEITQQAIANGVRVEALPGATAFVPALSASGLPAERFYFIGFLPEKKKDSAQLLNRLSNCPDTLIFYVSPHDIKSFVVELQRYFGNRAVTLARELSKLHEEYIHSSLEELSAGREITLRGEFVAVVAGKETEEVSDESLQQQILAMQAAGKSNREIVDSISLQENISANRVKKLLYFENKR